MQKMNKIIYLIIFVLSSFISSAQEINKPEPNFKDTLLTNLKNNALSEVQPEPAMADAFRSEGKIYVVIAVLGIIFLCIIGYLIYLDVKLRKIENNTKEKL